MVGIRYDNETLVDSSIVDDCFDLGSTNVKKFAPGESLCENKFFAGPQNSRTRAKIIAPKVPSKSPLPTFVLVLRRKVWNSFDVLPLRVYARRMICVRALLRSHYCRNMDIRFVEDIVE